MASTLPHEIKIAKEASITAGGSTIGGLLRYLFNILVARFLGVELLGFYSISNAVTQVAVVLGKMGLDVGTVRFVARLLAIDRTAEATATIRRAIKYSLVSGLIVGAALVMGAGRISTDIFHAQNEFLGWLLTWFVLTVPLTVVAQVAAGASQGFKVLKYPALALHVLPTTFLCLVFLALVGWAGPLWSIAVAYVSSQVVSVLAAVYFLTRLVPVHKSVLVPPEPGLLRFSFPLVLASIMGMLFHWSDIMMLGALTDIHTTGLYHPAARTAGMMTFFTASFTGILAPIISGLDARAEKGQIRSLLKLVSRWNFSITWPVFLFIWMYASKVMLVFGGDFLPMKPVLQLLALSQVLLMLGAGSAWVLIMTGHPKTALANNIITLTVNVLANLYLIPRYGPLGAALGTIVAVGVLTLLRLVEVGALHRMHPFSWMQLKPLLAGIVALAVCYLANRVIFDWHTVLVLVVGSIIFLAAYVGSLFVLGLHPDDLAVLAAARRKLVRIFL